MTRIIQFIPCVIERNTTLYNVRIRDGKNANFSLSLVIVILIFKNRYLSLFTFKKLFVIVSYFIIIVISIVMSNQ